MRFLSQRFCYYSMFLGSGVMGPKSSVLKSHMAALQLWFCTISFNDSQTYFITNVIKIWYNVLKKESSDYLK